MVSFTFGQTWIPFKDQSQFPAKPSFQVLKSDDNETIIEVTIPGMLVSEAIENGERFHILRFPGYFTTIE